MNLYPSITKQLKSSFNPIPLWSYIQVVMMCLIVLIRDMLLNSFLIYHNLYIDLDITNNHFYRYLFYGDTLGDFKQYQSLYKMIW